MSHKSSEVSQAVIDLVEKSVDSLCRLAKSGHLVTFEQCQRLMWIMARFEDSYDKLVDRVEK